MATLTLRIDDDLRDRLQSLATGLGVSVSDLVRSGIDGLFAQGAREHNRRSVVPESISAIDRKQLALLHQILARLVEPDAKDERLGNEGDARYQLDRAQALEEGWAREYDTEFYAVESELSRRDCGLALDIFDMFRIIKYSVDDVSDDLSDEDKSRLKFRGYDASSSTEGRLLTYARWIISDGDRWQEHAEVFGAANDFGNAHMPCLARYERMLKVYTPIWREVVRTMERPSYRLTSDELRQIAAA